MQQHDVSLTISNDVIKEVAKQGYVKEFGARPLRRTVEQKIIVPISQFLLQHPGAKKVAVKLEDDDIKIE